MADSVSDMEARKLLEPLLASVQYVKGVGPRRASILARLGIETLYDLLWHLPRAYVDRRVVGSLAAVTPGKSVTIQGTVNSVYARRARPHSRVRNIVEAVIDTGGTSVAAVWFNQAYLKDKLRPGARLRLFGKLDDRNFTLKMTSPEIEWVDESDEEDTEGRILPLYPLTEGLKQKHLRAMIGSALEKYVPPALEFLPLDILARYSLPTLGEALRVIHQPEPADGVPTINAAGNDPDLFEQLPEEDADAFRAPSTGAWIAARHRLIFEEFFQLRWRLAQSRSAIRSAQGVQHAPPVPDPLASESGPDSSSPGGSRVATSERIPATWPARYVEALPFQLTGDQVRAVRGIQQDMLNPTPMNRILQGEVGSGKTVVAFYALILAAAGGYQAAMMVPTEILAEQHLNTFLRLKKNIPELSVASLRGGMTERARKPILQALEAGSLNIVIGTHALFEERIEFDRLGLVVIDEQHKFGVAQRSRLVEKGTRPDLLLMSATPIPRTLALTWYGDMDISEIHELPAGRPPVRTRWTTWDKIDKVWEFVDKKLALGQQAYVVCPVIDPGDEIGAYPSAEEFYQTLSQSEFSHRRIALLHGRFKADERNEVMRALAEGDLDLVVATTVVEVGVDLPRATVMVVLGADRFGLAQLHQLRGRVGRGTEKSYCVLVTKSNISTFAKQRLEVLEQSRDGFYLAEQDLRLRGPGELFGIRQSGLWTFRVADPVRDTEWLKNAQIAVADLYQADPDLHQPPHCPFAVWQNLNSKERPVCGSRGTLQRAPTDFGRNDKMR
ncbi:MAG TPA: ATP-dependent DNA helicase RecG [bacterium]|nr:ATP-dependent DNA helicase RecG [bacterium]